MVSNNLWQILGLVSVVSAHSWIDAIYETSDAANVGFPRGYAGHDADVSITQYKTLVHDLTLPACGPSQRSSSSYSTQYPELQVAAGSQVTATYQENGHVTKDSLPPDNLPHPGQYSWFISPKDSSLTTFADLTDASQLSGPSSFDDGRCAVDSSGIQGRPGPIDCLSTFTIPSDLAAGQYQLEWYTTCLDIEVTGTGSASVAASNVAQESVASLLPSSSANITAVQQSAVPIAASPAKQQIAALVAAQNVPLYTNTSFTPIQKAAATELPESDVLVVTTANTVVTTTFVYEHPTIVPVSLPSPSGKAQVDAVANAAWPTMMVNPDGSLSPWNVAADQNGNINEVQAVSTTPVAVPTAVTVYVPTYVTVTESNCLIETVTATAAVSNTLHKRHVHAGHGHRHAH